MASSKKELIKERALSDLEYFINLVQPNRLLGQCHKDLIGWWTRQEAKSHQHATGTAYDVPCKLH